MSGALGILNQLGVSPLLALDWRGRLLPASFRGVPFQVSAHELQGGRRGVLYEYPDRDTPSTEDLGRAAMRYSIEAFVLGDDYDQARNDLMDAVFGQKGPGTLVHPYLGTIQVQMMDGCSLREQVSPARIAQFRLVCVEAGPIATARSALDTVARVIAAARRVMGALQFAYSIAVAVQHNPAFLLAALTSGLSALGGAMLGLPAGTIEGVRQAIAGFGADPSDTIATAAGIAAAAQAVADAYVAAPPAGADATGGLAGLATWSGIAAPGTQLTPQRVQEATNAQALLDLARGLAVAATAQLYAQADFVSADQAQAARAQMRVLIDARALAAADAGDDDGYLAWQDLAAACDADLAERAQRLPVLARYTVAAPLPALALAQRLYQSPAQADALAGLNRALHPMFMPASGLYLEAA